MASLFDMGRKVLKNPRIYQAAGIAPEAQKVAQAVLDGSSNRLFAAGLNFAGANIPALNGELNAQFTQQDKRVRLSLSPGSGPILYKDPNNNILKPLVQTAGILFPYMPNISVARSANYMGQHPTHSNYVQHSYANSSVENITVDGQFTANTPEEASYVFAVLHFLRTTHKMFYGSDALRGTPPPVLRLSGLGSQMFNSVPVVMQSYPEILSGDSDLIEVPGHGALIPSVMQFSLSLLPIYSKNQIGNFSLENFAKGNLIGSPSGSGGAL